MRGAFCCGNTDVALLTIPLERVVRRVHTKVRDVLGPQTWCSLSFDGRSRARTRRRRWSLCVLVPGRSAVMRAPRERRCPWGGRGFAVGIVVRSRKHAAVRVHAAPAQVVERSREAGGARVCVVVVAVVVPSCSCALACVCPTSVVGASHCCERPKVGSRSRRGRSGSGEQGACVEGSAVAVSVVSGERVGCVMAAEF